MNDLISNDKLYEYFSDPLFTNQSEVEVGNSKSAEDRKLASQAVAFVIKHSRKGIVSLCASVAGLLQERERIKSENKALYELLHRSRDLNSESLSPSDHIKLQKVPFPRGEDSFAEVEVHNSLASSLHSPELTLPIGSSPTPRRKKPPPPPPRNRPSLSLVSFQERNSISSLKNGFDQRDGGEIWAPFPLAGCLCQRCHLICTPGDNLEEEEMVIKTTWYRLGHGFGPLLTVGQGVVLVGLLTGQVCYLGHLDLDEKDARMSCPTAAVVWVGVRLDQPVGDCNGSYLGKAYFKCEKNQGLFVPLTSVLALQT